MPLPARSRLRRRWVAAAAVALTAPLLTLGAGTHAAFATSDEQRLSQLQHQASSAADDIGVRDAAAQKAALALAQLNLKVDAAKKDLAVANGNLHAATAILQQRRVTLVRDQNAERIAQDKLDVATQKYNSARDQLQAMLRSAFEQGVGGDLDALMDGGTPDQLAERVGLLDQLSASRQSRLQALAASKAELDRQRQAVAATRQRAQQAVVEADTQVQIVAAAQSKAAAAANGLLALQREQAAAVKTAKDAAAKARQRYSQLQAESLRLQGILAARSSQSYGYLPLSHGDPGAISSSGLVMPTTGVFTSGFGYRVDPFGLGTTFHAGQDIAAPTGTPIVAATAGVVAIVESPDQSGGYGNYTCIDRGSGFATCYAHQSAVFVHVGQVVAQGELIGLVGSTGASTGPHLHFEVRINGVPVDPVPYLP